MQELTRLKPIGFWCDTRYGQDYRVPVFHNGGPRTEEGFDLRAAELVPLPHPREVVDQSWCPQERACVRAYLQTGLPFACFDGLSYCRFECREGGGGCQEFTDDEWVWPEGLAHYVEQHAIRLPDAFLDTVRSRAGQSPSAEARGARVRQQQADGTWVEITPLASAEGVSPGVGRFRELRRRLERAGKIRSTWELFDWSVWVAWAETCKHRRATTGTS
jgi:hypothetical protein